MYKMAASVVLPDTGKKVGTGWLPPFPDLRDYQEDHPKVAELIEKLAFQKAPKGRPQEPPDLRSYCSPIEDQGQLGSCTAHAAIGIVEYFENRAFGKFLDGSRLFVYKATRNLMQVTGDTGAWLRNTMGALVLCGVPEEKYWPYTVATPDFDNEPPSFVYAVADNYESLKYICHDPIAKNIPAKNVLESVKKYLGAKIPSMFGFWGFPSFSDTDVRGGIPYPCPSEQAQWGHAIVAVGYNDEKTITNTKCNKQTKGALLIRNSWGTDWGEKGYGWLPYEYVLNRLALDFWSLLSMEWVDSKEFGF